MPSISHIIYIPAILLIGFAFGFRIGARAVRAELSGGPKTGLSPREEDSVLFFQQIDSSIVGRKRP